MIATEYCKKVFDGTHDSPKPVENGRLLITSKHIANRSLDISSAYLISEEDFENVNKRSQVHQWDILFSMIGTVGNVYIETSEKIDYAIKNMGVFSCQNKEKAYWLYYYLQSPLVQAKIDALMAGAVQKFVPLGFLRDLDIPEYTENSKKVVQVLSALDDRIALNKKMNQKLERMAKRLYDYWFVQFDFPDKNGRPYKTTGGPMTYNPTLKREIPAGWDVKSLFDCSDVLYGFPYATEPFDEENLDTSTKPYPVIRIRDIKDNSISAKTTETVDDKYRTKMNDLLIGMDGYFHMSFWPRNDDYVNQRITRIRQKELSVMIIYHQIAPFIKFKEDQAKGSTVGHLSDKDMKQINILVPNNPRLSEKFDSILNLITKNKQEISRLAKLRDKLLPLLMNGQVVVG